VSLQARGWGRLLAGLGPVADERGEAARALLAGWDGNLAAGSSQALLYACFLRALAEATRSNPSAGRRSRALPGGSASIRRKLRRWPRSSTMPAWCTLLSQARGATSPRHATRVVQSSLICGASGIALFGLGWRSGMALDGNQGVATILGMGLLLGPAIGLAGSGLSLLPSPVLALG